MLLRDFWKNVEIGDAADCWPWLRGKNKGGYGQLQLDGKKRLAHRVAWDISKIETCDGWLVCHTCDNPECCNPAHLYRGTYQDNVRDMLQRRVYKSRPGEDNPTAKLNWTKVREIRASDQHPVELASIYGVSRSTIDKIRKGYSWFEELDDGADQSD